MFDSTCGAGFGSATAGFSGATAGGDTTAGAFDTSLTGFNDVFVTKLNAAGTGLVYSTYLGGTGTAVGDQGNGIAVDALGSTYVTGMTESADFPTTLGAFDTTLGGFRDVFVSKLDPTGSALVYSTYLGGIGAEGSGGIVLDAAGSAYVGGVAGSADFPTTLGAFDTTFAGGTDAFVTKLNLAGTALVYSTYLGGSGFELGSFDRDLVGVKLACTLDRQPLAERHREGTGE